METKRAVWLIGVMVYTGSAMMVIMTGSAPAVTVDIYSGHEDGGSGVPYTDFVGSFYSPDIKFGENTENNWHPFDLGDFGAEITGYLIVSATDTYAFTLGSDDGSMLYIDNQLVVDNGAPEGVGHAYLRVTDSAALTVGIHAFRVEFFEDFGGPSGLDLILPPDVQYGDLTLAKIDDVNDLDCRGPGEEITYTISWNNEDNLPFTDVYLIDYLPKGVDYNPILSFNPLVIDPNYNQEDNTYTWPIGTIAPNDSGYVEFTVMVNEGAEPGLYLHNIAELWGVVNDVNVLLTTAFQDTPVCCWGDEPNMIYVDEAAGGYDTGVDWENAYSGPDGLQKALARIRDTECPSGPYTIYVAQGQYTPGPYDSDSFELLEGIVVYGGFPPGGCEFEYRNPDRYQTVLTAAIDPNTHNDTVVTMLNDTEIDETTFLDGFIITDAMDYGIYGDGVDFTVENCTIENIELYDGIKSQNCNVIVKWCEIKNNGYNGIDHRGEGFNLTLSNCIVKSNKRHGIYSLNSIPDIKNCVVFNNGYDAPGYNGLNILLPSSTVTLYNNTIVGNSKAGIRYFDSDPNYLQSPDYIDLQNCIIWYNNDGGPQVSGLNPDNTAYYCCIQDCNDISGRYNISDEPGFAYTTEPNNIPDPNNPYHLAWTSPCKDAGNPLFDNDDAGLYDIDAEDRISYGRIDIGADEVYSCNGNNNEDIFNALGWNANGLVNFEEFNAFQRAWLSRDPYEFGDPNLSDPNETAHWNSKCNLADTGSSEFVIDLEDLTDFIYDDWCWTACWKYSQMQRFDNMAVAMMSGGGESMMMVSMPILSIAEGMSSMSVEMTVETTKYDENPYADMSTAELLSLVQGIYEVIESLDLCLAQGDESTEDLLEAKEFLESVLLDIAVSRE